jgi:hypothetical protein
MSDKIVKYLDNSNIIETPDIKINDWYLPNRAGFLNNINENLKKYKIVKKTIPVEQVKLENIILNPHQNFVRDYLQYESPYRGLLLYHSLGSGKTLTAVATTELLIKNKEIIVILPNYLKENFINEIKKYGNKFYSTQQHWEFILLDTTDGISKISDLNKIDIKVLKKNKGVWISNKDKESNYNKKSQIEQDQINLQINSIIESRYNFIHLDGLTQKLIDKYKETPDFFENKVIVIDEVHNLISKVINKGLAKVLYEILVKTTNSKFICLSGTPLVNYAEEISYLVDLLKGIQKIYILKLYKESALNKNLTKEIEEFMRNEKKIDYYEYDIIKKNIKIKLLPKGFSKSKDNKIKFDGNLVDDNKIITDICEKASTNEIYFSQDFKIHEYLPLPLNRDEFRKIFINEKNLEIKNSKLFQKRILGAISYYTSDDADIYPTLNPINIELLNFSEIQFNSYLKARQYERKSENKTQGLFGNTSSVYKARSRAICNFVFPKDIARIYPTDVKYFSTELDDMDDNTKEYKKVKDTLYENSTKKALLDLKKSNFLNNINLPMLSPKMNKMYENIIKSKGTVLVYSQFRDIEGINIFSMVLEKRGYARFDIIRKDSEWIINIDKKDEKKPKYIIFDSEQKKNEILLSIYNSDKNRIPKNIYKELKRYDAQNAFSSSINLHGSIIKILMITKSGSEGISLKNVRQVHILEPYWNQIRIDQVIGRARRANSHIDLPKNERFIDTFLYLMKFTDKEIDDNLTIKRLDKSLTTDQSIYDTASRKMNIITKFQNLLKSASVDCLMNKNNKNPALHACYKFPYNMNNNAIITTENINDDEEDAETDKLIKKINLNLIKITILKKPFYYMKNTEELFDYNLYKNNEIIKPIGHLKKINNTQYETTIIKKYIDNI